MYIKRSDGEWVVLDVVAELVQDTVNNHNEFIVDILDSNMFVDMVTKKRGVDMDRVYISIFKKFDVLRCLARMERNKVSFPSLGIHEMTVATFDKDFEQILDTFDLKTSFNFQLYEDDIKTTIYNIVEHCEDTFKL